MLNKISKMENLLRKSNTLVYEQQSIAYKRALYDKIDWHNRLIGVLGAGVPVKPPCCYKS